MIKLITIHFQEKEPHRRGEYERLLQALEKSVQHNSPKTPLNVVRFTEDWVSQAANKFSTKEAQQSFVDNTNKMRAWEQVMLSHEDGDVLIIIDCDTLVLKDLSDVEADLGDNDVAFTMKYAKGHFPFNSGVIITRVNERSREFFKQWREINEQFLADGRKHETYRAKYGGINQAALGYMIDNNQIKGLNIKPLTCQEWNCEDSEWINLDHRTRILHIKSDLRRACLTGRLPVTWSRKERLFKGIEQFKKYDHGKERNDSEVRRATVLDEGGMDET